MNKIKIATFNVNSIRSRAHIVIPWIEKNKPEIMCMQETRVANDKFPAGKFEEIGYNVIFNGSKSGRNGVAIAYKEKPKRYSFGLHNEPKDEDRLIMADFSNFIIVNTYVPQGFKIDNEKYQYKLKWFSRLKEYFENKISMNKVILWCGDINVAPEDIDVHNPENQKNHVCFHKDVKQAYKKIISLGFIDIFRKYHNRELEQYTFFDYRVRDSVKRKLGWRVDHILASKSLAEISKYCYIDVEPRLMEKPSDHTILVAEFQN
jgi:exodeoxyribonuclease-3